MAASKDKMNRLLASTVIRKDDLRDLTPAQLAVLKDRGKFNEQQERALGFRPQQDGGTSLPAGLEEEEEEVVEAEMEADAGGMDYSAWTRQELQQEIDRRNEGRDESSQLSRSGAKDHLVSILMQDDASEE